MNRVQIFDKTQGMFIAAANLIVDLSGSCIRKTGRFTIALSGGSTPKKLYHLLASDKYSDKIDWKNVYVFWGDERYVPAADKDNNSNMAFGALLNHVRIPKENVFAVPVRFPPQLAATSYEETLLSFFKSTVPTFDLILLGLGTNGHTASLFPYSNILQEQKHIVKEVFVEEVNMYRITFTANLINRSNKVLFLVSGKEKAEIIKTIFEDPDDLEKYPVQLIKPIEGEAVWFIDSSAASLLK